MERPDWVPEGIDITVPNAARMYDYALGGYHNFAVDRELVDRIEQIRPGAMLTAHANRAFLGRAVRWLAGAGIRQFLDIGSGIPTLGNVHEIAEQAAPGSRVLYVDIDPVAVAHGRAILGGKPRVGVLQADLREPIAIVDDPEATRVLDFGEPVAVVLAAVLHFIPDADDPAGIVARLRDGLVSGSYFVISHGTEVAGLEDKLETFRRFYEQTPTPFHLRSRDQLAHLLAGLVLVEPGIVPVRQWRPNPDDEGGPDPAQLAAVARTP